MINRQPFVRLIARQRARWSLTLATGALVSLVELINPYLVKLIVDQGLTDRNFRQFILWVAVAGGIFVVSRLLHAAQKFLGHVLKAHIHLGLNRAVFRCFDRLPYSWFCASASGEHLYKLDCDTTAVVDFLTDSVPEAVGIGVQLAGIFCVVVWLDWKIAVGVLVTAPFFMIPPYFFNRKIQRIYESLIAGTEQILVYLQETFSHVLVIKLFGTGKRHARAYARAFIRAIRQNLEHVRIEICAEFTTELMSKSMVALIGLYGGYQVIHNNLALGSLTAIAVYLYRFVLLLGQAANLGENLGMGLVSVRRISRLFDESSRAVTAARGREMVLKRGDIRFDSVSFGYSADRQVLDAVSLAVGPGSWAAIVGPSGCGKTTLLSLLVGLYTPGKGQITIDGVAVSEIDPLCLKRQIGFAAQEPYLWNDTIENNIRYAKPKASPEEVRRILEVVGLDEFVRSLPGGISSAIGENACKISEGQKQRIAIGRALCRNPRILILDEAMASIDPESEAVITAAIKRAFPDMTVVIVSHRLSSIAHADRVFFLNNEGRIRHVEPQDFFETDTECKELFSVQKERTKP